MSVSEDVFEGLDPELFDSAAFLADLDELVGEFIEDVVGGDYE